MTAKKLTAACMIFAMSTGFVGTAFAEGEEEPPPECLSGCEPEPTGKGNNGWGNGADGDNPGTDEGPASQVDTKENRVVWDKFIGKFDGR